MPLNPNLKNQLIDSVGAAHVLLGNDVSSRAKHYWNSESRVAAAIVRPSNTREVSEVLALCNQWRQRVVTHGGLTGLVDGDRTDENDLVLSLERMSAIESIDNVGKTITVQAGCVLEKVQQAAAEQQLSFGLDLGARGSCTIGGNISTNAGGLSVLRYGMTREQVLGLEVVLMDGRVISSMNTLIKNNAGHDLKHLFIGSEGTLGVITRAVLRLRPPTYSVNTAFLACASFQGVTDTLKHLEHSSAGQLHAFEVLWKSFVHLNTDPLHANTTPSPIELDAPYYIIAETRGIDVEQDSQSFAQAIEYCFEQGWACDGVVAQSQQERQNIWAIRENIELMLEHDPLYIFDISLPIASMVSYIEALSDSVQVHWPGSTVFSYGHLADGNLHVGVTTPAAVPPATPDDQYNRVNRLVFEPLQAIGGSISAEHGIGLTKKEWLRYSRNDEEIKLMQSIKTLFDERNLLNTGRIVN
jgi:FAD/FMN-containing dehydrogenase